MVLLVSAGSETTAILLSAWTYCVCTNPDVYERLVSEIRGSFTTTNEIKLDTIMDLPYLGATVNEALRLFPPGSVNQQRIVPPGGATIDGFYVPGGLTVSVAPWAAGHSPLNFCEPDKFRPERWLSDCDEKFSSDKLHASQPFGLGPKGCLGKNLSYFESRLIISHLLWNFDMELEAAAEHGEQNKLWSTDPDTRSIKVYQALVKPNLWVRLKEIQH
jgi:cytochrome P450